MNTSKKINRALISVYNKEGLVEFAQSLNSLGIEIYSTGGTLKKLQENNIPAISISEYTQFPEILGGRVKTLHPKVHAGILAKHDDPEHQATLQKHNILLFDLICIQLYPFEEVVKQPNVDLNIVIENIDIGGPAMIRAAAKNFFYNAIITDVNQYQELIDILQKNNTETNLTYREVLAMQAFQRTAEYDSHISRYFQNRSNSLFPQILNFSYKYQQALRYGENPHQQAGFYTPSYIDTPCWQQLHGKELSYNNILDFEIAIRIGIDFKQPMCAILKHNNPCGIAVGSSSLENLTKAIACDPVSHFGGIVVFNQNINIDTAQKLSEVFYEIIVTPKFEPEALTILKQKKNIRLIEFNPKTICNMNSMEAKAGLLGLLLQEDDTQVYDSQKLEVVTKRQPTEQEKQAALFAFQVVKFVKSNAIVFTDEKQTLGIGAGQMSRVDSIKIAIRKANEAQLSLQDSILASDAFFPFKDSVEFASKQNIKGIIQPGGSIRDQESIDAADKAGIFMMFTHLRHFRH